MNFVKKLESVEQRLAVAEGYIQTRNVSKQQLRLLYGAMEKIQMVEIDGLNVGEDEELKDRRKSLAVRANMALNQLEELEAEGFDGNAIEALTGGFAISASLLDVDMVVSHNGEPPINLSIDIPPSDSGTFSNNLRTTEASVEDEVERLEKKLLLGYKNCGLIAFPGFRQAMVSTFNVPACYFLPSRIRLNKYSYMHSHDVIAKGGMLWSGADEKQVHLIFTYDGEESLWITMVSQKNDTFEVLYGACHSISADLSLSIRKQLSVLSGSGSYVEGAAAVEWTEAEVVTVWMDCDAVVGAKEKTRKNPAVVEVIKHYAKRLFSGPLQTVRFERFGRGYREGAGREEAFAAANCGGDGDEDRAFASVGTARCTIGIFSDVSTSSGSGFLMPFVTPHHRLGPASSTTKVLEPLGGSDNEGELSLRLGVVFNSQLEAAGDIEREEGEGGVARMKHGASTVDLKYEIILTGLSFGALKGRHVAVKVEYTTDRAILVNVALCPRGGGESLQWMAADLVIDGDTDPGVPLTASVVGTDADKEGGGEADSEGIQIEMASSPTEKQLIRPRWKCESEAQRLKEAGNEQLKGGSFEELAMAYYLYSLACTHDPGDAVLWSNRSACALHLAGVAGDATGAQYYTIAARKDASVCTGLRPDWAKAWGRLGDANCRQGEFKLAVANYREALSLEPSSGINDKLVHALKKVEEAEEAARRRKDEEVRGKAHEKKGKSKSSQCSCM